MGIDLAQFHEGFFDESFEALSTMESALLTLNAQAPDPEIINTIFRVAHSIKGGAGIFSFTAIASLTHTLETLLDELRSGRKRVSATLSDLLLRSVDVLREMLRATQRNETYQPQRVADLQFELESAIAATDGASPAHADAEPATAPAAATAEIASAPATAPAVVTAPVATPSHVAEPGVSEGHSGAPQRIAQQPSEEGPDSSRDAVKGSPAPTGAAADSSSIRVSVEKIDELINTVGEIVITQAMLSQLGTQADGATADQLRTGLAQLERNVRELQESVMRVRMLPIGFAFSRFPRLVRDVAQRLGKNIDLKLSGEQTELDKTVLERIGDPLVHLVRNSIDHGIEMPEARIAAGKPAAGTVRLEAFHRGSAIIIEVSDDGRGLDGERILAKARSRGLIGSEVLSTEAIHDLIFLPGFSTAEQTTDLSGRGVGMDVVRRNVKALGGKIEIKSQPGLGSRFIISLPLTLAIVDGQSVRVGSETYIVPLISIVESLQVRSGGVNRLSGANEVFAFRGDYLPIIRLHDVFGVEPRTRTLHEGLVVVVEGDGERVGLFVDDLRGQQQVVIKSLESNYGSVPGVSGATILGDGSVALILDVSGLIRCATGRAAAA